MCRHGYISEPGSRKCVLSQEVEKRQQATAKLMKQIVKTFSASRNYEQEINSGQVNKLHRMVATADVRREYDEMREKHAGAYQKHGKTACEHEDKDHETKRRIHIMSAIPLDEEVDDKTCLSTNRDELVIAFCNFRKDFDMTLSKHNLGDAKEFWPNICLRIYW